MKYRRLGKTGLRVSVVGIGTYQYGGEWGRDFTVGEVKAILERGRALGCNLIDTAECYGDHLSEALIGRAVKGTREQWVIATKFGHNFKPEFQREARYDPKSVQDQLEASLRALQTNYIDLYLFHSGTDAELENDKLWTMLGKQVQAGKVRHLGISLQSGIARNLHQTEIAPRLGVSAIEVLYNRLDRNPEAGVFQACIKHDLGVLARVPLASGILSGKYKPGMKFPTSDVRSMTDKVEVERRLKLVEEIQHKEVPKNVAMAGWAIAWTLQHPAVSTCVPGFKNVEQLEVGLRASELGEHFKPGAK